MENLAALLPALACPLIMGIAMALMMRGHQSGAAKTARDSADPAAAPSLPARPSPVATQPRRDSPIAALGGLARQCSRWICLDRRVVIGLGAIGIGIWVLAPGLLSASLPLLIVAACPLSMLLMMRGMGRGGGSS